MNKADLIDRIASGSGISKAQAATAIDTTVPLLCAIRFSCCVSIAFMTSMSRPNTIRRA